MPTRNGDKFGMLEWRVAGGKKSAIGKGNAGYEEYTYNVQIGQAHAPSVGLSAFPVTEVEVMVCWTMQPPPGPELVVAIGPPERSLPTTGGVLVESARC